MDYFFAQIEEKENPQFKGFSVVVGADPKKGKGRGVVSTCNYEARKFGIKSGMPISRSYKLNPDAVYLPVNMSLYKRVSESIFKIVFRYSKTMERISLDEAYLDLTGIKGGFSGAMKIGEEIRDKIYKKEKLTCTVGIAENKMLAKIACEEVKPNGIKIIMPKESEEFIIDMPVEKIPGIGPKSRKKLEVFLNKENILIKDVKKISKDDLVEIFGKRGGEFYRKFRGKDDAVVLEDREAKSIGREYTFQKDTRNPEKIMKAFRHIVREVSQEADKENIKVKAVVVVCRFEDFETHTKQNSFLEKSHNFNILYKKSVPLLLKFLTGSNKKIRLIGLRLLLDNQK